MDRKSLQPLLWLQVAFATKPVFHRGLQPVQRDAVARLENAVAGGKSIVKNGVVGEVAHGKVVNLADGTGMPFTRRVDTLDRKAPRKHGLTVIENPWVQWASRDTLGFLMEAQASFVPWYSVLDVQPRNWS